MAILRLEYRPLMSHYLIFDESFWMSQYLISEFVTSQSVKIGDLVARNNNKEGIGQTSSGVI
jgi:hypothetical protein